jgi:hypothetical protein
MDGHRPAHHTGDPGVHGAVALVTAAVDYDVSRATTSTARIGRRSPGCTTAGEDGLEAALNIH